MRTQKVGGTKRYTSKDQKEECRGNETGKAWQKVLCVNIHTQCLQFQQIDKQSLPESQTKWILAHLIVISLFNSKFFGDISCKTELQRVMPGEKGASNWKLSP